MSTRGVKQVFPSHCAARMRRFANRANRHKELATHVNGYYADYFLCRSSSLRSCISALYKDLGTSSLSIRIMSAVTRSSVIGSDKPTTAASCVNVWAVFCPGSTSPALLRPASKPSRFKKPSRKYMLLIHACILSFPIWKCERISARPAASSRSANVGRSLFKWNAAQP
jgi:hypothetical protein